MNFSAAERPERKLAKRVLMRAAALKASRPFSGTTGRAVVARMRKGKGSVQEQFEREREETETGTRKWKKTKPFGKMPAPDRTLHRTGALQAGWTGGAGSIKEVTDTAVGIGVDGSVIPYAGIFQRNSPARWRANPNHRGEGGRLKAFMKLGRAFGVWVSEEHLLSGWPIMPRRVGVGRAMRVGIADVVLSDIVAIASGSSSLPSAKGASK